MNDLIEKIEELTKSEVKMIYEGLEKPFLKTIENHVKDFDKGLWGNYILNFEVDVEGGDLNYDLLRNILVNLVKNSETYKNLIINEMVRCDEKSDEDTVVATLDPYLAITISVSVLVLGTIVNNLIIARNPSQIKIKEGEKEIEVTRNYNTLEGIIKNTKSQLSSLNVKHLETTDKK